jgi:ABC-2 type transport system ATP-binding protein
MQLEISSLMKRYGDQFALDDVSFAVSQGEVLGLIGPNGAGKTTLLEATAGLLPADSRMVAWQGRPIAQDRRRDVMFYVPDAVGIWRIEQECAKKVLAVNGRQWKKGQSSAGVADKARALYGERYAEFLDRVQAYA